VESQLQSLRAQLHPHFLFNALNTIGAFTESNPQMARRLMAQLGDLLRASLRHAAQPLVTLGEELTFLDDFLAIESARFEGRLHMSDAPRDETSRSRLPQQIGQTVGFCLCNVASDLRDPVVPQPFVVGGLTPCPRNQERRIPSCSKRNSLIELLRVP
jgi:hypothetical protein